MPLLMAQISTVVCLGQKQVFPLGTLFFTADGRLQEEQLALRSIFLEWFDPGAINFDFGESILEGAPVLKGPLNGMKLRRAW